MLKIILRKLNVIVLISIISIIVLVLCFLYVNSYKTLVEYEQVTVLRSEVASVRFKDKLWDTVVERLNEKEKPSEVPRNLNNPFIL